MLESLEQLNIKRMSVESPEHDNSSLELTDSDIQGMNQTLDSYRSDNDWWRFTDIASDMKNLGLTLEILPSDIQGMNQRLDSYRSDNEWWGFTDIALALQKFSSNPPTLDTPHPIPEQRNF